MRGRIVFALVIAAIPAAAQSRPETRDALEAVRPAMARARTLGGTDADTAATIVEALLRTRHAIAAPWWVELAETSGEKLSAADRETLARLRKACDRPEAFADERKIVLKLVRHAESLIADKKWEDARLVIKVARGFLGLVSDPALARLLETAEKRIPARKPEEAAESRIKSAWPPGLELEAANACRALIDLAVTAYGEAGCRPGRYALARSIRRMGPALPPAELATVLERVRILVAEVEPNSRLTVFVRTVGTARLYHEGLPRPVDQGSHVFDAEKHEPIDLPVLPGDVVAVAIDEPYSSDDVEGKSFVLAFNARFEGRDLGLQNLSADVGPAPNAGTGLLAELPIAKKKTDPPKSLFGRSEQQDAELRTYNSYFELPRSTRRSVDVPCLGDMIAFMKEFEARKLGLTWIGTETDRLAVVVEVPAS
jgi:hypothetical protein